MNRGGLVGGLAGVLRRALEPVLGRSRSGNARREREGRRGERLAAKHLRRAGYRVLARNAIATGAVRGGVIAEADLICEAPDERTIVIVEVKTRTRGEGVSRRGNTIEPERQVDGRKRRALRAMATRLVRANRWHDRPMRIDVVAVEIERTGGREKIDIRHHVGAIGV
jgi:putative endonuclease